MKNYRTKITLIITFLTLAILLYASFIKLDEWTRISFAQPVMGSALVGVIQLFLFFIALCLAPGLSRLIGLIFEETKNEDQR